MMRWLKWEKEAEEKVTDGSVRTYPSIDDFADEDWAIFLMMRTGNMFLEGKPQRSSAIFIILRQG